MFVTSYSVTYCIYIRGKPGIGFHCIVQFMMSAYSRIRFGLQIVFVCLYITPSHYHHCANFIWRHWTYKMHVRYNLSSVWVRLSIFSQLSIIQHVGLCVFSLPISFVMIERIYILCLIIIIKSEVWTITPCLGLGHETMVCAVCLSIHSFEMGHHENNPSNDHQAYTKNYMYLPSCVLQQRWSRRREDWRRRCLDGYHSIAACTACQTAVSGTPVALGSKEFQIQMLYCDYGTQWKHPGAPFTNTD